jgi:hypothetical protein
LGHWPDIKAREGLPLKRHLGRDQNQSVLSGELNEEILQMPSLDHQTVKRGDKDPFQANI